MKSYRRSTPLSHLSCAGETGGAYDPDGPSDPDEHGRARDADGSDADDAFDPDDPGPAGSSPLPRLVERLEALERAKRDVLDTFRDVAAWGGTAQTTGYSQSEYLALIGRLPSREAWKFDLLVRRLPACPVTAVLLESGQITFDQAISIVVGTKRLSGDTLAAVERAAAEAAVGRNERGDDPDVDGDVEALVQQTRTAAEQDRRDRDRLDRNRVRVQPDLFGAGQIFEDWADPEGFQTRLAAIEHAAGPPTPDSPRGTQLAEGSLATARAWLAGRATHPVVAGSTRPDAPATDAGTAMTAATAPAGVTVGDGPREATRPADPGDVDGWLLDQFEHTSLPISPDDIDLGPSTARPTFVVRIDIADLDGIDPDDPDTLRALSTGSPAAFGRLAAAGRLSSTPWLGRQLLDVGRHGL